MLFLKNPYGIVCEDHKIYLYNYETQETEKTFILKDQAPSDFCIRLALGQILDMEQLLKEMTPLEKQIFVKLLEEGEGKYFVQEEKVTLEKKQKELLKYEGERIGSNYANSLPYNAKYKVYKNLKENIEKTAMIVCGRGRIANELMEQLQNYPWGGLYLWDEEVLSKAEQLQKKYPYIHVIYTTEQPDGEKIRQINAYMEKTGIAWSLLTADSERLIIGPTQYPGQSGCLSCNFELDRLQNKYNLMPYEVSLMVGMIMSDIGKIIGTMEEAIVEDIAVTIGRAFFIDRRTMEGTSKDMERHLDCTVCGPGRKNVVYVSKTVDDDKAVV